MTKKMIEVDALALRDVLTALNGPPHLIREMQATISLTLVENPIRTLIEQYNAAIQDFPK